MIEKGYGPDISWKEYGVLKARIEALEKLVMAVRCSEFEGAYCEDVDGKNWFDMRNTIIGRK